METEQDSLFDVNKLSQSSLRKYKVIIPLNDIKWKAFLLIRGERRPKYKRCDNGSFPQQIRDWECLRRDRWLPEAKKGRYS